MPSFLLAAAALALAAPAAGQAPLQPTKPWVVDYAETFCTAAREYGTADAPLQLVLRPSPAGDLLQIFVIRNGPFLRAEHVSATIAFDDRRVKGTALVYSVKRAGKRIVLSNLGPEAIARIGQPSTISVQGGGGFAFAVPGIEKAMAALATCNADLREHWNMTDDKKALIATPATLVTRFQDILSYEDYPSQALREEDTGKARVLLLINEQGKVGDCLLEETSGNASLDAMTCIAFVARARFHPALDAAGKPVRTAYSQSVSWRISGW